MPKPRNKYQVHRRWCFTSYKTKKTRRKALEAKLSDAGLVRYGSYGREVCPKTKKKHLQGFVVMKRAKTLRTMKTKFGDFMHFEPMMGTLEQSEKYCSKEDENPFVAGTRPAPGSRLDLPAIRELAAEEGIIPIVKFANFQQIRVAEKYLEYCESPRDWEMYVYWIWGDSGTGKSRKARACIKTAPEDQQTTYIKSEGSKWWSGYDRHYNVIIDDFRGSWWKLTEMLSLLDKYEKRVETKGGHRQFVPHRIFITSIKPPKEAYREAFQDVNGVESEPYEQLKRRITKVIHMAPFAGVREAQIPDTIEI